MFRFKSQFRPTFQFHYHFQFQILISLFLVLLPFFSLSSNLSFAAENSSGELATLNIVNEENLDFPIDELSLAEGNGHVAVDNPMVAEIPSLYPEWVKLDFLNFRSIPSVKMFLGRYMVKLNKPVSAFTKEKLHTSEGFLIFGKDLQIIKSEYTSERRLKITTLKSNFLYSITSDTDYDFFQREEASSLGLYSSLLERGSIQAPEVVTIQHIYNFNRILKDSLKMCTFSAFRGSEKETLLTCYSITAMDLSFYNKTRWLVNMKSKFTEDFIQMMKNFQQF